MGRENKSVSSSDRRRMSAANAAKPFITALIDSKPVYAAFTAALLAAVISIISLNAAGCSRILVPNPPDGGADTEASARTGKTEGKPAEPPPQLDSKWVDEPLPDRRLRTYEVDFARAFEESPAPRDTSDPKAEQPLPFVHSMRYPTIRLPKRPVRVMLRRNIKTAAISSSGSVQLRAANMRANFSGGMNIEPDVGGPGGTVIATVNRARKMVQLPCTLFTNSGGGRNPAAEQIKIGQSAYRGALIIVPESGNNFSIINMLNVEDYLRGVVPLEIGNLRESEIEAVKAQAVAARTYTYKRMEANAGRPFDVVATVADQVYGGATAETEVADMAVLLTKDLIMAYEDEIVHAYYHSTCGGRTANIEDVWGSGAQPYLRSVNDAADGRAGGRSYCAGSTSYTWTETWPEGVFVGILRRYSADGKLEPAFSGSLRKIEARERFACGRVRKLVITSSGNREHVTGGDRLRFLLRRNIQSRQILRSSNIKSISVANGQVTITGGGYGHGIGMCQVGAIGRAREGQSFDQILKAYYSGVFIRTIVAR